MRNTLTLWQPPDETIEAIGEVLSSRWSAARSQPAGGLFWPGPTSWLGQQARRLGALALPHHRTSGGKLIK